MAKEFEERAVERMLQAGISLEHIQLQKRIFFQNTEIENYYDKAENSESLQKDIPVPKIIAATTDLDVEGKSVYDLFMGIGNGDRDEKKIMENLHSLEANGLAAQRAFYSGKINVEGTSLIRFNYFQEDDCYILQNDGIHRLLSAKMFNAPVMSGLVTTYRLNEEKKKLYEEYDSLKEILRLTDIKGFTLDLFQEKMNPNKKRE
ncbi:hypothetical protein [Enterococcus sp. DIV0756]|uniref:hypothetical protein n=1 Tax=Enterococcus sp. DIV0756 TaxID=2774636 RepID=UPI003F1EB7C1